MFILRNVTDEHVGKWVITKAGSDSIVAYDADLQAALTKAKAAGVEQPDATIVFVHPAGLSQTLYALGPPEKDIHKILGDQRKGVSIPVKPTFFG